MMQHLIILPVLVHLITGTINLFFWGKPQPQRVLSLLGTFTAMLIAFALFNQVRSEGVMVMHAANWKAPFGISFVADTFSSSMVLFTSFAGLAVSLFSAAGISKVRAQYAFYPIFHFLLMGLNGAFLTGDLFNLYVWFEVIIMASFVLITLGGSKAQMEGGVKYVSLNLLASVIFLTAIAIVYGLTGTLNLADLAITLPNIKNQGLINITALLFFIGFGIKSAVFPLYFWLPSSYHTPPSAVAAIFAGLLTKVGIYAMLRMFTLLFHPDEFMTAIILIISLGTMLTGALGAIIKTDLKRMFSYLIICHIGYMVGGLALFTQAALGGAVFYLFHDMMIKTNLFLIAGVIKKIRGTTNMPKLGGLYHSYPKFALLVAIVIFSLAGTPPLSGFWPKIYLFQAGFANTSWASNYYVIGLIFSSLITLYVLAKMWKEVFWKKQPDTQIHVPDHFQPLSFMKKLSLILPIVFLACITLYIGLDAERILTIANDIAKEMLNPKPYIKAVLGHL